MWQGAWGRLYREEFSFTAQSLWPQEEGLGATVTDLAWVRLRMLKDTPVTDKTYGQEGGGPGTTPGNQRAQMRACGALGAGGTLNEDAAGEGNWLDGEVPGKRPWAGDKVFESSYVVSEQSQEGVWEA